MCWRWTRRPLSASGQRRPGRPGAAPRRLQAQGPPAADSGYREDHRFGRGQGKLSAGQALMPPGKTLGNRSRASRGGPKFGLHFLLSRPTSAGAGGGTHPPQPGGPQPSPHLGRRRRRWGRSLTRFAIMFAERMGPLRVQQPPHRCHRCGKHRPVRPDDRGWPVPEGRVVAVARGHPGEVLRTEWQTWVLSRDREASGGGSRYQRHDLLSFQEIGQGYSLVLCKNVLLHFQPPERIEVLRMFHRALAPGGLFASEQTQEMPPELDARCSSG